MSVLATFAPALGAGQGSHERHTAGTREVLFLDPKVQDGAQLLGGLREGVAGRTLAPGAAPLEQAAALLEGEAPLQAIHLVAHGAPGRLFLGTAPLTAPGLRDHLPALRALGGSLARGGAILVHGCAVGAGPEGQAFLEELSRLAGAPVAAASAPMGRGGSWDLDRKVGEVRVPSPFTAATRAAYGRLLAPVPTAITLDFTDDTDFSPMPNLSGWLGAAGGVTGTYSKGGTTWSMDNVMRHPGTGTITASTADTGNTGSYAGATVVTTLLCNYTFELKSLDLLNASGYSGDSNNVRIQGYLGSTLVADTNLFVGAPSQDAVYSHDQSGALASFSGLTIDKIVFTCFDSYDLDSIQVIANLPPPCANVSSFTAENSTVTTASSVKYLLAFDKAVTGLTAGNFELNPTLTGASITGASPKSGTGNASWEITVNTGTADGALNLRLANATGLSTTVCDSLPKASTQPYTIDRTSPTVSISGPSPSSTGTGPVTYIVTYLDTNFATSALTAGDIIVNTTGTAACGSGNVTGTGNSRTVTLSSLSGNGTVAIQAKAGTGTDAAGNTNALSGTSTAVTVVNKVGSTTSLASSLNPSTYGQSVTFTATVTAGATGTVTFKDGSTTLGTATLASGTASFTTSALGGGSRSLTAVYGGDSAYNGSTAPALTQVVNTALPSHTLTSSLNPSSYGQSATFTATLSAGTTGTVTFRDGSTTLGTASPDGSGVATLSISTLSGGSHSITSVYGGDANWAASTSPAVTQVVNPLPTTTSFGSSLNPSSFSQSVTLTATVTSGATGTVTFKDGSTTLGTGTLSSGTATFNTSALASGSHSLTAVYGGDSNYSASTSSTLTQVVNALATTTSLSASPNPSTYSQTVVLTATVTSGATGTVTFRDGSTTLGTATLSSGTATYAISSLAGGAHSLTATYNGNANYNSSTSSALSMTVAKASFTLPIATGPTPSTYGQPVTVATALPNDAGGSVIFRDGSTTIATVPVSSGGASLQTTTLPVGSHSFSALYSGDSNYLGATSGTVTQVVDTASSSTSLSASPNPAGFGQAVTLTATVTSGATGTVTFKDGSTTLGTATLSSGSATLATATLAQGSHSLTAIYGGNTNFTGSTSPAVTLTVNPPVPAVTGVAPGSGTRRGGNTVTLSGSHFTGSTAVTFGTTPAASFSVTSDGTITATAPAGSAGTVDITVTSPYGTSATGSADRYTYWGLPGAPGIGTASAGDGQATVSFTAPASDGGSAITGYTVTSSGGQSATGSGTSLTVTGLGNGTAYTFTVTATTGEGTSPASDPSDYAIPSPGGTLYIVHDGGIPLDPDRVAQLTARAADGSHLTVTSGTSLPANPAGYDQIWDLRPTDGTPLGAYDRSAYLTYLQQGGQLVLVGESNPTGARNASLALLTGEAGGATLALAAPASLTQSLRAPFSGPVPLASHTYTGAAGSTVLGNGAAITSDGTCASAIVWAPGTLAQAGAGTLVTVFDADFLDSTAPDPSRHLLANLLNYLTRVGGMSPKVTAVAGPAAGTYKAGVRLAFTVTFDQPVTVTGSPRLPLTIGGATAYAAYTGGSGTQALTFACTVQAGDNGALALGQALDLTAQRGTLEDAAGFPARTRLDGASLAAIQLDTAAPAAPTITSITGNTVAGTAEANNLVTISLDGVTYTVAADADGRWSWTLPAGTFGLLVVTATDAVGNTSSSAGTQVNTYAPVANPVSLAVAVGSAATAVPLNITTAAATTVAVASAPAHGSASASGTAIAYTPAAGFAGTDTFTYTAGNAYGTSAPATVTVTVTADPSTAPRITLSTLSEGALTADPVLNVSGVVSAGNGLAQLTLDGLRIPFQADGSFSHPVRLKRDSNTFTVVATDRAGLTASLARTVILDPAGPTLELGQPSDGAIVTSASLPAGGTVTFPAGSADTLVQVAYILNDGAPLQAVLLGNAFSFSADLAPGRNTLEVVATTAAGASLRAKRSVTFNAALGLAVTDPPADQLVTADSFLLKGRATSTAGPVTVTITVGGQVFTPAVGNARVGAQAFALDTASTGYFEQALTLDSIRTWPVQVTVTDASARSMTLVRNLLRSETTGAASFTMADAERALRIVNGLSTASAEDLAAYDLAPRNDGAAAGDGAITLEDAMLILWLASGHSL